MANLLFLALGVLITSGVLSMVEASLFSYSITRGQVEAARGNRLAKAAIQIREKPFKTVATFVLLSSVINVGGSIAMGSLASSYFSSRGIGIFSAVLTFCTIILAEIIPKNLGERWSHRIFPVAAVPLKWLTLIFSPIVFILEIITKPFTHGESPFTTSEEEIALLTKVGARQGMIEGYEAEMIQRVFQLNDITAGDMMSPKPFVSLLDGNKTIGEVAEFVKSSKHSRIPVFEVSDNNVVGVAHQRDMLRALAEGDLDRKVSEYAHEVMIIPETRLADDLLRDFQEKKSHLAVVVSEYGNVVGVVGLEDIVEELVGEIIDEKDVAPELIKRISKNEIIAHGQTRIISIDHFFNTEIGSKKTINGWLLDKFGYVPKKGKIFEAGDITFVVEEVGSNQIERVRILRKNTN
ncbi:MAG: hemolysin family protein [Candidatus Taylorbacteria bacterium]|nr:hemolysin family protein [Candidatus Taylorbacteria bacterium]